MMMTQRKFMKVKKRAKYKHDIFLTQYKKHVIIVLLAWLKEKKRKQDDQECEANQK